MAKYSLAARLSRGASRKAGCTAISFQLGGMPHPMTALPEDTTELVGWALAHHRHRAENGGPRPTLRGMRGASGPRVRHSGSRTSPRGSRARRNPSRASDVGSCASRAGSHARRIGSLASRGCSRAGYGGSCTSQRGSRASRAGSRTGRRRSRTRRWGASSDAMGFGREPDWLARGIARRGDDVVAQPLVVACRARLSCGRWPWWPAFGVPLKRRHGRNDPEHGCSPSER
jgi:hypothetical protein